MSAQPRQLVCPILQDTRGLSRTARARIQQMQKSAGICADCPCTGECQVLDRLLISLQEALEEVLIELEALVEDLDG